MPSSSQSSARPKARGPKRRLLRPGTVIGLFFLLLIGLALLAIPFLKAPGNAKAAKADLESAKVSLGNGDMEAAETAIESARKHADELQGAMQGIGGDIWSLIPVVGFIASIAMLVLMVLPGTAGPNRFGNDPKDPGNAQVFA